jgi:hypothetical protein
MAPLPASPYPPSKIHAKVLPIGASRRYTDYSIDHHPRARQAQEYNRGS